MDSKTLSIIIKARDDASSTITGIGNKFNDVLGTVVKTAGLAAVATASVFAVSSLKNAADYEQSLAMFNSVAGATAEQMTEVGKKAKELGNDITLPGISAKDAALAMTELAKAGLTVNDTLAASKGVLALAKAGQLDTAEAATIAANALNAFNLEGDQAGRVADILAAAANASSADVKDLAYGFQMASSSFASVKAPIDDLAISLGLMSNNGIAGSDAGTSLKTMFANLIPTTDKAKESMKLLNLDFYDAQGNFKGVRDLIDQLQKGTAKLTDEQKSLNIENIFGADSSRAANILIKEGIEGYDKMSTAVKRQGAAADLAAAQNSGFNGAVDNLKSTFETLGIELGQKVLPFLTKVANEASGKVIPTFNTLKEVTKTAATVFMNFAPLIIGATTAFVTYTAVVGTVTKALELAKLAQIYFNAVLNTNPIILAITAIAGLAAALGILIITDDNSKASVDRLTQAQQNLTQANKEATDATKMLNDAQFNLDGANLRVEASQRAYNEAVKNYGPDSLEARQAMHDLKGAQDDAATAAQNVNDKLEDQKNKLDAVAKKKDEVVQAQDAMAKSADNASGSYKSLSTQVQAYTTALKNNDMKAANQAQVNAFKIPTVGKNAKGTDSWRGGLTWVGEEGPELINLQKGAQVIPSNKSMQMAQGGGQGATVNTVNFYGSVSLASADAVDAFAKRFSFDKEMGNLGVGI